MIASIPVTCCIPQRHKDNHFENIHVFTVYVGEGNIVCYVAIEQISS